MVEDKVITLGPNIELLNLVSSSHLDDRNYLQWAQYIRTTLKGRKKLSHIEGNGLPRDDSKFEVCDDKDSFIMTWLWNSMTQEISQNYMLYSFVCEIWENLIETYSMKKDSTACYDIESKIFNSRQGTLSVTEYYRTLNWLWIRLDQYQGLKMCRTDSIAYARLVERGRIFKFLHGLNSEYDPIQRGRLELLKSKGESYLEVEFVIESLPIPTQDIQVQVQEVTELTLVLEQVQLSKLEVSIPKNPIEDVTDDLPIALRKGKRSLSNLEEEVYMEIPPGFYSHNEKNKSLRAWFGRFAQVMISLGYRQSQGSIVDRRSIFGYCMFLGGNLVTWRSKKQNVVARSSIEAKFQAMTYGIYKGLWMKIILNDLKVKYEGPIKLFSGNNSTISVAHNPVQHDRTKHIEIKRHFIKKKLNSGLVVTTHAPTGLQVADIFTKGLPVFL
ncbi:Copia protein, partial [Mucuna pruriens]